MDNLGRFRQRSKPELDTAKLMNSMVLAQVKRSRRIVEERWLKVNDDASGGITLHELAAVYGVSAERIRQIEVAAMKKMKKSLAEYS